MRNSIWIVVALFAVSYAWQHMDTSQQTIENHLSALDSGNGLSRSSDSSLSNSSGSSFGSGPNITSGRKPRPSHY